MKITRQKQCSAIVQPGEYLIDRWDNQQCTERNPRMLIECVQCKRLFCMMHHWHLHLNEGCT